MEKIIVTRHPALVEYLLEQGIVDQGVQVLTHVETPDQIRGMDVIGVLPLHLAALAHSVMEVPLALSPADRGQELSISRLREIAGKPMKYHVSVLS